MPEPNVPLSVSYQLSEAEVIAANQALMKLQAKLSPTQSSYFSALHVPLAFGAALIFICTWAGISAATDFLPLLVTGIVGYLCGYYALRYEIMRAWNRRIEDWRSKSISFNETYQVQICPAGLAITSPTADGMYRYHAIAKVAVVGDILVWIFDDEPQMLAPVRAFANAAQAEAFAAEIRARIKSTKTSTVLS